MTDAGDKYNELVDQLRENRSEPVPDTALDRRILAKMEDELWEAMTDEERSDAIKNYWRGWPDLYQEKMKEQDG